MLDLLKNVPDQFRALIGMKLVGHSPESDANHVAVMQLRPRIFLGQFEPHLVRQIQILGP